MGFTIGIRTSHALWADICMVPIVFFIALYQLFAFNAYSGVLLLVVIYIPRMIVCVNAGLKYAEIHIKFFNEDWHDLYGKNILENVV